MEGLSFGGGRFSWNRHRRSGNSEENNYTEDWLIGNEELFTGVTTTTPMDGNFTTAENNTNKVPYYFYRTEQLAFLYILLLLIVVGNVSVLVAISLSKKRKSRMNFFIMQLAIADLVSGLVIVLTDLIWKTTVAWHAGTTLCKIVKYLQSVATFASTYVLVALSIDRLDAIANPMNFSGSGFRAKVLVAVAWGLSLLFSVPMLILCRVKTRKGISQCQLTMPVDWGWKAYMTALALILFIIPAIIIGACYSIIIRVIWQKSNVIRTKPITTKRFSKRNGHVEGNGNKKSPQDSHTSSMGLIPKARIKTVKMTLVIVFAFVLCWSPYFVFDLLDVYRLLPLSQEKIAISIFIQSLSSLNSAANPVIYCLFSTRICQNWRRFSFCDWLARKFCCCCADEPPTRRRPGSITNGTDFTSCATEGRGLSKSVTNSRRHSGTPYVKVTLSERDNEILLRNLRTPENKGYSNESDIDNVSENVSSV